MSELGERLAAQSAFDEQGEIVARLFCADCHNGKVLGLVRKSSAGLVFGSEFASDASYPDEMHEAFVRAGQRSGSRYPGARQVIGLSRVLLDRNTVLPEARCTTHGALNIDVQALNSQVVRKGARIRAKPTTIV